MEFVQNTIFVLYILQYIMANNHIKGVIFKSRKLCNITLNLSVFKIFLSID